MAQYDQFLEGETMLLRPLLPSGNVYFLVKQDYTLRSNGLFPPPSVLDCKSMEFLGFPPMLDNTPPVTNG